MQSKFAAFGLGALVALLAVTTVAAVDPLRAGSPSVVDAASVTPAAPAAVDAAALVAMPVVALPAAPAAATAAPSATATRAPSRTPSTTPGPRRSSSQHRWVAAAATAAPRQTHRQSGSMHSGQGWSGGCDCCGWY